MMSRRLNSVHFEGRSSSEEKITHYRITMMGASCVGKSSIIAQFLNDRFIAEYRQTVEELYRREYDVNGSKLTLDILDTAGNHEFPAMRKLAIASSDAFILVYSVDNKASFEEVKILREQIIHQKENPDVPIVIVGNKVDVCKTDRTVAKETAETIACIEWGCGYVESSAKNNINIEDIFVEMLKMSKLPCALTVPEVSKRKRLFSAPTLSLNRLLRTPHRPKRHSCSIS